MTGIRDWSGEAVRAHARATGCCASDDWRDHLCEYHRGMEDGMDAVGNLLMEGEITPADIGMELDDTIYTAHGVPLARTWVVPS